MIADYLSLCVAGTSAAMDMSQFAWNIPVDQQYG